MRSVHDARGTVDHTAQEVVVAALVNTNVQSAAHPKSDAIGRIGIGHLLLQLQCGGECVDRVLEDGMDAVAGHLYHYAVVVLHGRPGDRIMARERKPHPLGLQLPKPGAALDVGEEKCGDGGKALHARGLLQLGALGLSLTSRLGLC